jgi:hypothetical protein
MRRATWSQGELWWLTTPKGSTRHEIAAYQKRITREQAACGHPQYSVWIFETRPELHAHILFVGNRNVADALRRSRLCIAAKIEPITDIGGLKKYLGIAGHEHQFHGARRHDPVEGRDQRFDLGLPAVEFLRDQQPVRYVVRAQRE